MPAKITLAIRRIAARERKREEMALLANKNKDDAYNRVYKPPPNIEEEGGDKENSKGKDEEDNSDNDSTSDSTSNSKDKAGRKPSNSSLYYKANKNEDNTYNRAYKPPANTEEEGGDKDNSKEEEEDNGDNNGTSNSTSNSKDKAGYKPGNSSLHYKDIPLYKRQYGASYPYSPPSTAYANIYIYYI
ncbi:hypothetical protein P8C59_006437 [Phyllachora maydis]|uniref:Uncharacterized protein n=1 Tax=Phyllachora maydis TaxID=1825666 RepID=A0AAD9MEJ2_9PEZI|nr:hypothetical protein P8C59_006437 [Phyllachora maydis]